MATNEASAEWGDGQLLTAAKVDWGRGASSGSNACTEATDSSFTTVGVGVDGGPSDESICGFVVNLKATQST